MSDTITLRDSTAGDPRDACLDAGRLDADLTPPYAGDLDITDLQQWIDLCA